MYSNWNSIVVLPCDTLACVTFPLIASPLNESGLNTSPVIGWPTGAPPTLSVLVSLTLIETSCGIAAAIGAVAAMASANPAATTTVRALLLKSAIVITEKGLRIQTIILSTQYTLGPAVSVFASCWPLHREHSPPRGVQSSRGRASP